MGVIKVDHEGFSLSHCDEENCKSNWTKVEYFSKMQIFSMHEGSRGFSFPLLFFSECLRSL